jgi:hypothetical protein
MSRPLAEIDADIAEAKTALKDLLLGRRPQSIKRGDREIAFGSDFRGAKQALEQHLAALQVERARALGLPSPVRPYVPRGIGADR